jgi:hypothetical protein
MLQSEFTPTARAQLPETWRVIIVNPPALGQSRPDRDEARCRSTVPDGVW